MSENTMKNENAQWIIQGTSEHECPQYNIYCIYCSRCGGSSTIGNKYGFGRYCPFCGAKMGEEEKTDDGI